VRRLPIIVAAALLASLAAAPSAQAELPFKRCGNIGFQCARLSVPLDRTGQVRGRVSLFIKRLPAARRATRPPLVALAGGPGQSATAAFDFDSLGLFGSSLDSRSLLVVDQRGSGRSGLLRCPRLERSNILRASGPAADCARRLGARRAFYTSKDTADDLDAVRRAVGARKLALFGVSYGTRTATAYALRHPARVDRMVLDSVVESDGPDSLYATTFAGVPRVLGALCGRTCARLGLDPLSDLRALTARFSGGPLRGRIVDSRGRPQRRRIDRLGLFSVLLSGDFDPSLRSALPGAARSALRGDPAPLLRLNRRSFALEGGPIEPRVLSTALYAATTCEEARLPWARGAPFDQRRRQAEEAAASRPASAFEPFDRQTALKSDIIDLCSRWPESPASPVAGPGPLPDVPTLLVEGEDDLRTPIEAARTVAAQLPRARLLVVAGVGHSPLSVDTSGCSTRAFSRFLNGRSTRSRCPGGRPRPTPPAPTALSRTPRVRGVPGIRGRAAGAVALTLADAADDALSVIPGGGLRGGTYRLGNGGALRLKRLSYVPGVRVSGVVRRFGARSQRGAVRVSGPRGARGLLRIRGLRFSGRLGGRRVRGRLIPVQAPSAAATRRLPLDLPR
jgi:pimeloyl-ACP methyl ester carboxylesterase